MACRCIYRRKLFLSFTPSMEGLKANLMGSPSIMRSLQLFLNDSSKNCRVDDATKKEKKCQSNNQAIKNVNTYWLDSSSCTLRALRSVLVGLSPRPSDASSYGLQFLRLEQSFWIHPVLAFSALVRGEPSLTVVHETWGRIRGKVSIFFLHFGAGRVTYFLQLAQKRHALKTALFVLATRTCSLNVKDQWQTA